MNLLPKPRAIKRSTGVCRIPDSVLLKLDESLSREFVLQPIAGRINQALRGVGSTLKIASASKDSSGFVIDCHPRPALQSKPGSYKLRLSKTGIQLDYADVEGLRNAVATLRQLIREYGRKIPAVSISDYPTFKHRGLMLDISRGRVPKLATLLELVDQLADLKLNEFQLYTEHTFAYRKYKEVWEDWGAITPEEIQKLDIYCRKLGIELVPNQNSFGHLRYWLEHEPMHQLAETPEPWPDQGGLFLRHPATLAPNNPGTLPFLRGLFDELLPNFSSSRFNVGCDETWDLGRGQSKALCEKKGKAQVYVDFLKQIHREVKRRDKQMLFWGDIIMNHPELVAELPKDMVCLNWGYEANHPFAEQANIFEKSGMAYYVCPGTSTWMSMVGRHDNGLANLEQAGVAGRKHNALGYLNTDWGDGGHLQPLAVSFLTYIAGADAGWSGGKLDVKQIVHVLNRDVFKDPTGNAGAAALKLGLAHKKLNYTAPNVTPLGAVIAAPPPALKELFCRDGLKYFARIPKSRILATLKEIEAQRARLKSAKPQGAEAKKFVEELKLAAWMAAESCEFMLWQQDLDEGNLASAKKRAKRGIKAIQQIKKTFDAYWPTRNKSRGACHWPFLKWRLNDYRSGKLPIPREVAAVVKRSTSAD